MSDGVDFHPGDQPFFVPEQDAERSCTVGETTLVDTEGKWTFDLIWKSRNIPYDLDVKALLAEFLRLGSAAFKIVLPARTPDCQPAARSAGRWPAAERTVVPCTHPIVLNLLASDHSHAVR